MNRRSEKIDNDDGFVGVRDCYLAFDEIVILDNFVDNFVAIHAWMVEKSKVSQ